MKEKRLKRKVLIFLCLTILINVPLVLVISFMKKNRVYVGRNEFVRTIECSELFDLYPENQQYSLSFDIKSRKPGKIRVYQQNGGESRYSFIYEIDAEKNYKHYELVVCPKLIDSSVKLSYLAFYGEYGSGIIPTVKNITLNVIEQIKIKEKDKCD